jgi:hypothetical protein
VPASASAATATRAGRQTNTDAFAFRDRMSPEKRGACNRSVGAESHVAAKDTGDLQ